MNGDLAARAAQLARDAHAGQLDKQGRDYYEAHLVPIADSLAPFGEYAWAAGILHDIVEDTSTGYDDLAAAGIPPEVVDAVRAVTRVPGERYQRLIERACAHPFGRLVKLADNWHNLNDLAGLEQTDPATAERLRRRYVTARQALTGSLHAAARGVAESPGG